MTSKSNKAATGIRNRLGRGEILIVLAMTLVIAAGAAYYALGVYFRNAGLRPGLFFMEHDLGGLKRDDALERIRAIIASTYHDPVYLHYRSNVWILRHPHHYAFRDDAEEIWSTAQKVTQGRSTWKRLLDFAFLRYERKNLSWTPTLDVKASTEKLYQVLSSSLKSKTFAQPVESEGSGEVTSAPQKVQIITLSGKLGVQRIIESLQASIRESPITTRRVIRVDPKEENGFVQVVDLHSPEGGFSHRLASKTTRFDPMNLSLKTNVELAARHLDGYILNPGETFSFNGVVGERNLLRGFQEVPSLVGEKIVNEMGRGVSQVASTLYQPALECGARVVERYHHLYYIPDVKFCTPGLDVRVAFGSKDFKFGNVQNFPILLDCTLEDEKLIVTLWGTQPLPFSYRVKTGRVINEGHETRTRPDGTLAKGLEVIEQVGIDAYKVKVFRHVFMADGRKVREEIVGTGPDYYLSKPAIIRVGTASASSLPPPRSDTRPSHPLATSPPDFRLPPPALPPESLEGMETTSDAPGAPSDVPSPMLDLSFPQ